MLTDPGGGVPPGIIVAFLGALQAAAVAVGVLAGAALVVAVDALVGSVQSLVALGALAQLVLVVALVHTEAPSG